MDLRKKGCGGERFSEKPLGGKSIVDTSECRGLEVQQEKRSLYEYPDGLMEASHEPFHMLWDSPTIELQDEGARIVTM